MIKPYRLAVIVLILALAAAAGIVYWTHDRAASSPVTANPSSDCTDTGVTGSEGIIVAISGNHIVTHDPYLNQTTTITIGPQTRYYEPDLTTPAVSSSVLVVGQAVTAGGRGCDWSSVPPAAPGTIDATMSNVSLMATLPDIAAPAEWYAHRTELASLIFTRQEKIVIPSSTEIFALGAQIDAGAYRLDHSPDAWAAMNIGTASGTIGAPPADDWGTLDGYRTIHAAITMGEAPVLIYAIFDPAHYTVYEFTLYPYPNATDEPILHMMVRKFAATLSSEK